MRRNSARLVCEGLECRIMPATLNDTIAPVASGPGLGNYFPVASSPQLSEADRFSKLCLRLSDGRTFLGCFAGEAVGRIRGGVGMGR